MRWIGDTLSVSIQTYYSSKLQHPRVKKKWQTNQHEAENHLPRSGTTIMITIKINTVWGSRKFIKYKKRYSAVECKILEDFKIWLALQVSYSTYEGLVDTRSVDVCVKHRSMPKFSTWTAKLWKRKNRGILLTWQNAIINFHNH